jgi:hypothetical protein
VAGLVYSHIKGRTPKNISLSNEWTLEYYSGAGYVKVKPDQFGPVASGKRGKRSQVVTFSAGSRRRMREALMKFGFEALTRTLVVELTYPGEFPAGIDSKRHFNKLLRRLRRRWADICVVWKLEYQKRGAPHYHLCIFGADFIPKAWLKRAWFECVGSSDRQHLEQGARVDRIRSLGGLAWYFTKYIQKGEVGPVDDRPGRFWGVWGNEALYQGVRIELKLDGDQAANVRRLFDMAKLARARLHGDLVKRSRAVMYARRRRGMGFSAHYMGNVDQLMRVVTGEPLRVFRARGRMTEFIPVGIGWDGELIEKRVKRLHWQFMEVGGAGDYATWARGLKQ